MATKKKSWKHLGQQEFKTIKALQDAGLSVNKTCNVTGRGSTTVKTVYEASDIADYHQRVTERNTAYREKAGLIKPRPEVQQPFSEPLVPPTDELLLRIAIALEALVIAWNQAPAKKKLF